MRTAPDTTDHRRSPRGVGAAAISVAGWVIAAIAGALGRLVRAFLVPLAAGPYPAAELYDPSEEYEHAREVLAMERLITGRMGSVVGAARVMRLFGGIEPMPGLAFCTAAQRRTPAGDKVYLAFELDPLLLDPDGERHKFCVEVLRTSGESAWRVTDRREFADATAALLEFYSDRSPRPRRR